MADVLDQNEIDSLLNAVASGDLDSDESSAQSSDSAQKSQSHPAEIRNYDFKRPERVSKAPALRTLPSNT